MIKFKGGDIEEMDYASQGNAVLGLRDSGKSYTATYIAEKLLDKAIPIVVYDPVGIWRYLKVGIAGPGYQVVVVGGKEPDIPLTPDSAEQITRAAMKEGVSIVFDMLDASLSKSDWRKIVGRSLRVLLYENEKYGLRHVFIEEAAEFIPQKIGPDQGVIYSEFEKLARMGRNFSLGYTLINQRPEEVNKAVLELCDCLFLHRQKGKNSILSLQKWLKVTETIGHQEIIRSMTTLPQGQCWFWKQSSNEPQLITVPEKSTVHPSLQVRTNFNFRAKAVNVNTFVSKILKSLEVQAKAEDSKRSVEKKVDKEPKYHGTIEISAKELELNGKISKLEEQITQLSTEVATERARNVVLKRYILGMRKAFQPMYDSMKNIFGNLDAVDEPTASVDHGKWAGWIEKLSDGRGAIIKAILENPNRKTTRQALVIHTKLSRESIRIYSNQLLAMGLLVKDGEHYKLAEL